MTFNAVIEKIMPEVEAGSTEPFMVYKNKDGEWEFAHTRNQYGETFEWVEDVKEHDHYALTYTGKDFSRGSLPFVYDTVLADRIRAEYYVARSSGLDTDSIHAMTCFFVDNVAAFSPSATDYLTTIDKPLAALMEMCPFNMTTGYEDWSYNEDLTADAIDYIERNIYDRTTLFPNPNISRPGDRQFNDFVRTHSVQLAGQNIVIAENPKEPGIYLLCNITRDNPLGIEEVHDIVWCDDYLYAMQGFARRIEEATDLLRKERIQNRLPNKALTSDDCITDSKFADWTGKLIVIKPETLSPEYRGMAHQLVRCTGGFGANPESRGNAVFVTELLSGKACRYERSDIAGIADMSKLPQWAVERLMESSKQNHEQAGKGDKAQSKSNSNEKTKATVHKKPTLKEKLNAARVAARVSGANSAKPARHKEMEVT